MNKHLISSSVNEEITEERLENMLSPLYMGDLDISGEYTIELSDEIKAAVKKSSIVVSDIVPVKVYGPNIRAKNDNGKFVALHTFDNKFLTKGVEAALMGGEQNGG